jgi:multidrug efflux pump subunit AcrB
VDGIKKMTATAGEGIATLLIEVERGYDATEVSDKIKVRVDTIDNLPEEAEEPTVEELLIRNEVISLAIYGNTDVKTLKEIAELIRDELNVRESITQVDVKGVAEFEISINVSEISLREYGITFDDIVLAIRSSSVDIPGGSIKSQGGEILLRTTGKAYTGSGFEDIPVITRKDGTVVRVRDLATVEDGFVDDPLVTEFNGQRAVLLRIFAVGDESALDVSGRVQAFAKTINNELPEGIQVEVFRDFTYYLKGRLQMLIENGIYGLLLVLLIPYPFSASLTCLLRHAGNTDFVPRLDALSPSAWHQYQPSLALWLYTRIRHRCGRCNHRRRECIYPIPKARGRRRRGFCCGH